MSTDYDALLRPAWEPVENDELEVGTPVRIFVADRGSLEQMQRKARNVADLAQKWTKRNLPLECWAFSVRKPTDPWGGYEVWAEYHGAMDRVQDSGRWRAKYRRERRAKSRAAG